MLQDELRERLRCEGLVLCEDENTGKCPALIIGNEILISRNVECEAEKNSSIIHEIGHYMTSPPINLLAESKEIRARYEYRADRAGILEFITLDKLLAAYKAGCRNCWEICDYLEISERYFLQVMKIYCSKYGVMVNHKGWLFTFNPLHIKKSRRKNNPDKGFIEDWEGC